MEARKILDKLEDNLCHFLIGELCKADPTKRGTPELYKYKGLSITADPKSKAQDKTVSIRIGVLEAEFKVDDCEKCSGCLSPDEERLIMLWLAKNEINTNIKTIFTRKVKNKKITIIPFDLENFYLN